MSKRILVVDNDASCREVLHELLLYYGFEVKTEDGQTDVLKLIDDYKPDVLLIDYLLDGVNGGEWCAQIKKDSERFKLPVIMISAHSKVINSLGTYGCDSFIAKPFDIDHLINKIHELTGVISH